MFKKVSDFTEVKSAKEHFTISKLLVFYKIAVENVSITATYLFRKRAKTVIAGCIEFTLAIQYKKIKDILIIDATKVLMSTLIRESKKISTI